MKHKEFGREHWRVVVSLVHVDQKKNIHQELESISLPGLYSEHTARRLYVQVAKVAEVLRELR